MRRTDRTAIVVLWCVGLLAAHQFAKIALVLGPVAALWGRTEAGAALLVSAVGAAGIVLGVTAGVTVAALGARRALLVGIAGAIVVSLLQASMPAFPLMVGSRLVEGVSHLLLVVAAPTLMARAASEADQPLAMGLWGTFFGIGFATAAFVYPPLVAAYGFAAASLAHAGLMAVAGIAAARLVPPDSPKTIPPKTTPPKTTPPKTAPPTTAPPETARQRTSFVAEHVATYRHLRVAAPGLVFVWHTVVFVALLGVLPAFVAEAQRGVAAAAMSLTSLVGTLVGGWASRFVSPLRLVAASFLATALAFGGLALASPSEIDTVAASLVFLVIGLAPGACFAAVPQLSKSDGERAKANGAVAQLGNVGTVVGPPLFATVATGAGLGSLLVAAAVINVAGFAVALGLERRLARDAKGATRVDLS